MAFPVLVDACALLPLATTDLILRLAHKKTFQLLWSEEILAEVQRNLVAKLGIKPSAARRRVEFMRESFPAAAVDNYESLVTAMTCDKKDRHVLAAAVRGNAEVIVTANLKDFPRESTHPYDIEVKSPDDFLADQLDLYPALALEAVREAHSCLKKPPMSLDEYLENLENLERIGLRLFVEELKRRGVGAPTG